MKGNYSERKREIKEAKRQAYLERVTRGDGE
jgi:hypothetical protein